MKEVKFNTAGKTAAQVIGFIQLAIGDDMPHEKFCGYGVNSKAESVIKAIKSKFLLVSGGMISLCNDEEFFKNTLATEVDHLGNEVKPHTKTEYVKCEFEFAWQAVKFIEDGGKAYRPATDGVNKNWIPVDYVAGAASYFNALHEKVEKEIDWCDEALVFLRGESKMEGADWQVGAFHLSDSNMIKFCRLVESLTRHIEV